jgi:hypothetical protein
MKPEILFGLAVGALMIITDMICARYDIGPSVGDVIEWLRNRRRKPSPQSTASIHESARRNPKSDFNEGGMT